MECLNVSNLHKTFETKDGGIKVIQDFNCTVHKGEVIAIVGPSGTGKSTILNIIAGIVEKDEGTITKNGEIGYMFQQDLLFDWLTVEQNILLPISIKRKVTNIDLLKVHDYLDKYNLASCAKKYPKELSGGMRQRIALIRTLFTGATILLLDEPFSALDAQTRILVSTDMLKMIKENNCCAILVTHDILEALTFADKVIVLTNRPARIKRKITPSLEGVTPLERRKDKKTEGLFELIWNDLNEKE